MKDMQFDIKVGKENTEQCNSLLYIKPRLLKKHFARYKIKLD